MLELIEKLKHQQIDGYYLRSVNEKRRKEGLSDLSELELKQRVMSACELLEYGAYV